MRSSTIACAAGFLALGGAPTHAQVYHSAAGDIAVETVAKGLDHPWALAFLPDGRMLVTERPGRLRIVSKDGKLSPPLAGVPKVFALRPGRPARRRSSTAATGRTRRSMSATPSRSSGGARTALARAQLVDEARPGWKTSR